MVGEFGHKWAMPDETKNKQMSTVIFGSMESVRGDFTDAEPLSVISDSDTVWSLKNTAFAFGRIRSSMSGMTEYF
jgi:hypothetical protein